MKKCLIYKMVLIILLLAGCGNVQDANETNFGTAIKQYLDKENLLFCIDISGGGKFPIDVGMNGLDAMLDEEKNTQMKAFSTVGLVTGTDATVQEEQYSFVHGVTGTKEVKIKRYAMTDAGQKAYCTKEVDGFLGSKVIQGGFSYGKLAFDKVVKWEGPLNQQATVKYLYKIDDLADWAKKPEFQAAFPQVAQNINNAGQEEQSINLKLTNLGWEVIR